MDLIIAFCARHWKIVLVATVILCLAGSSWLFKSQKDELQAEIDRRDQIAAEATTQTENNLEHIRSAIPVMVATAQAYAVENYRARFGSGPVSRCDSPFVNGLQPQAGGDRQDASASGTHAEQPHSMVDPAYELAKQCAETTALYNAWRELCRANSALCEVKE